MTREGAGVCELQMHYVVPEGHVFVMGDNRANSNDSRYWGSVPLALVKGRVIGIWLTQGRSGASLGRFGAIQGRSILSAMEPMLDEAVLEGIAGALSWTYHLLRAELCRRSGEDAAKLEAQRDEADVLLRALIERGAGPLATLVKRHELQPLEEAWLRVCLARHVDAEIGGLFAELHGREQATEPVLSDLPMLIGSARMMDRVASLALLSPRPRLRVTRLVDVEPRADGLLQSPVRLTAAAAAVLTGREGESPYYKLLSPGEERAVSAVAPEVREQIEEALRRLADGFAVRQERVSRGKDYMMVLLFGPSGSGKGAMARTVARRVLGEVIEVDCEALAHASQPHAVLREVVDRAVIEGRAVVLRAADHLLAAGPYARSLVECMRGSGVTAIACSRRKDLNPLLDGEWSLVVPIGGQRPLVREVWGAYLGADAAKLDLGGLAERYPLEPCEVERAVAVAVAGGSIDDASVGAAAELQLDGDLGGLVRTLFPSHGFDELVVPEDVLETTAQIIEAYLAWPHLLGDWGMRSRASTGRCISCLFSGEPGTGKTFAAEVIAAALGKPLHVVALPAILSKWVGETERNLAALFAKANANRALLLFDEADALFASRVEAKTSHDHDRNMMTSALLQEIDRHSGLVILTTNFSKNIDRAFQRRIMFSVEFPMPEAAARVALWRKMLPAELPRAKDLALPALAQRFAMSGGEIRNAVLRAAAAAWTQQTVLTADLLVTACEAEYRRSGKLFRQND